MNINSYLKYIVLVVSVVGIILIQLLLAPKSPTDAELIDKVIESVVRQQTGVDLTPIVDPATTTTT